jgi:hypothetical protein
MMRSTAADFLGCECGPRFPGAKKAGVEFQ